MRFCASSPRTGGLDFISGDMPNIWFDMLPFLCRMQGTAQFDGFPFKCNSGDAAFPLAPCLYFGFKPALKKI